MSSKDDYHGSRTDGASSKIDNQQTHSKSFGLLARKTVPELKRIAAALRMPIKTGMNASQWRGLIMSNKAFIESPHQYVIPSFRGARSPRRPTKAFNEKRLVRKQHIYQVAACTKDHVGEWRGLWEDCHIIDTRYAPRLQTKPVSALVLFSHEKLGIGIMEGRLTQITDRCEDSLKRAGIPLGAKIVEIQGKPVPPNDETIFKLVKSIKQRPLRICFEWKERVPLTHHVQIILDGTICKNVPARFVRHKFRHQQKEASKTRFFHC